MIYDILTDEQIQRFEGHLELDCSYSLARVSRFRVNVYKDKGHDRGRLPGDPAAYPDAGGAQPAAGAGGHDAEAPGLVLVTGPTGSGKSTTLAAMINQINQERSAHIITIEDPIEYLHQHGRSIINQRELGGDTRRS